MEILKYKLLCKGRHKLYAADPKSYYTIGPLFDITSTTCYFPSTWLYSWCSPLCQLSRTMKEKQQEVTNDNCHIK